MDREPYYTCMECGKAVTMVANGRCLDCGERAARWERIWEAAVAIRGTITGEGDEFAAISALDAASAMVDIWEHRRQAEEAQGE